MVVRLMVAITADGKIARSSDHFPDWTGKADKKLYVQITKKAGVMIMGSKTFDSIGRVLPGRKTVVMTRNPERRSDREDLVFTRDPAHKILTDLADQGYVSDERFVEAILASQDDDGYIGIYPKGFRFHFCGHDGELWTQRCVMLPLLAYYEFTGRKDVLDAVQRAVKLTISQYGPGTRNYFDNPGQRGSGVAHGLMFLDVLEWLYRLLQEPHRLWRRYLIYNPLFILYVLLQITGFRRIPIQDDV